MSVCTKDNPSSNIDLNTLLQKALNISEKFYDISETAYKDDNIVLELRLTPEGVGYVETSLFKEDYLINVDIFIAQDEKNIFSKENIEWNLAEETVKELRLPISDEEQIMLKK